MFSGSSPDRRSAARRFGIGARRRLDHRLGNRHGCAGRRAAAAADDVEKPPRAHSPISSAICSGSRRTRRTRWAGRRWGSRDVHIGDARKFLHVGAQLLRAQGAVQAEGEGPRVAQEFQNASVVWPDRVRPEASVMVPEIITGSRRASVLEQAFHGEHRRLGVERVEHGLDQQQVGAALDQGLGRLTIGRHQLSKVMLRKPGRSRPARCSRCGWSGRARRRRSAACRGPSRSLVGGLAGERAAGG
jgi:hypothetical protein